MYADSIRLNYNENTLIKNKKLIRHLKNYASKCNIHPEMLNCGLKKKIAKFYRMEAENVIVGNGIDELAFWTCIALQSANAQIITTENTYRNIEVAGHSLKYNIIKIPLMNYRINIDMVISIMKTISSDKQRKSILYICNPHNPFGTIIDGSFTELLNYCYENSIIIFLDEAYAEYASSNFHSGLEYLQRYDNIIIARTFSKVYGMAGLRCGYLLTRNKYLLNLFNEYSSAQPTNVNYYAQLAATEALDNQVYLAEVKKRNEDNKAYFMRRLTDLDFYCIPSETNFLTIKTDFSSNEDFCKYVFDTNNILIKNCVDFNIEGFVRVTIGKKQNLMKVVSAIKSYAGQTRF
jgi:histidinol-phosphate aminotransferase